MGGKRWTLERIQKESNRIHINKFIIHSFEIKEVGVKKEKKKFINIECKHCGYKNNIRINDHINGTQNGCKNCYRVDKLWTKEKIQIESNKIHNNKFTIHKMERKNTKKRMNVPFVLIECNDCKHITYIEFNDHKKYGCNGKCKLIGDRKRQIKQLKDNPQIAKQISNLYFLKFTHKITNEQFYKVGKTRTTIKQRFANKEYNNYIIEEYQVIESNQLSVALQEDDFINRYNEYKYIPKDKFGGHTECFRLDITKEFTKENK
jgi:ribosomal protein S27E